MTAVLVAAGDSPTYLGPVVGLLVAAAVIGYISVRLRIVPIVGFLLAGVLIGPHQLGLVAETSTVQAAADIGVMLLLFTIGVEFSLPRLASIKRLVLLGGGVQVLVTTVLTAALVMAFGASFNTGLFTGFLVALSSTAIVLKVLSASGRTTSTVGRSALGTLIFQDLAVVLMVLIVPLLGTGSDGDSALWDLSRALGTAAAVLAVVLVVARRVMPPLLERVARTCSPEVFLLSVVAIAIGTAYLTSLAGVSLALGAFLAGLVVSESRHSAHALGEVLPLQIIFSAAFFVSIGMLLDLGVALRMWWVILALALAVIIIKVVGSMIALTIVRVGVPAAVSGSLLLAQIGEFSFVLQRSGSEAGLDPAGLGSAGEQVLIAVTVVLMVATPALSAVGQRLGGALQERHASRQAPSTAQHSSTPQEDPDGAVLISGWGPVARSVAATLSARGVPVTVTTLNPDLAAEAQQAGHSVVRGDPVKENVLVDAGLHSARLVVICENDDQEAASIATVIHQLAPAVDIIARPRDLTDAPSWAAAGAHHVVDTTTSVEGPLTRTVLEDLGLAEPDPAYPSPTTVVDFRPDPRTSCPHVTEIQPVLPSSAGCIDCLRSGRRDWVHLRTCLHCGHVGCCDSSPGRHARSHAEASSHSIMASAEPTEAWAWCFLDEARIEPR